MLTRKRRLVVASLSSLVWPALVVLIPAGITFAAARVYAESSLAPQCSHPAVLECADAAVDDLCTTCGTQTCACASGFGCSLEDGGRGPDTSSLCLNTNLCDSFPQNADTACQGKANGDECPTGRCVTVPVPCLPNDGGRRISPEIRVCSYDHAAGESSSSGSTASSPDAGAPRAEEDSGCSISSSPSSLSVLALPLAVGISLALRRKRARRAKMGG